MNVTLHMLTHMPTHPDCSRYLHFFICTPLRHTRFSPSKSMSTSLVSRGPTSHLKNIAVMEAFVSADHCNARWCVSICCWVAPDPLIVLSLLCRLCSVALKQNRTSQILNSW